MATLKKLRPWIPVIVCALAAAGMYARSARPTRAHAAMPLAAGTPGGAPTSRDGLAQTIAALERRIADEPGNGVAAARLADALLRQARATGNGGLAIQAEGALRAAIAAGPSYEAQRMLGAVLAVAAPLPGRHRRRRAGAGHRAGRRLERRRDRRRAPRARRVRRRVRRLRRDDAQAARPPPPTAARPMRASCRAISPARCG